MSDPIELRTDGPHRPEYTREVANAVAEGIRVLNYATLGDAPGLDGPDDAYSLIAALYTATQRMPQLAGQITAFLAGWQASGQLADSNGLDPTAQVALASYHLGAAHASAMELTAGLRAAQNAIAGLYVREGTDGSDTI